MATTEFGTGKSIVVLAIVVGCFAILWPKIFYPMMQAAFSMTSPKQEHEDVTCQVMFERDNNFFFAKLCFDAVTYDDVYLTLCDKKASSDKLFDAIFKNCRNEVENFCNLDTSTLENFKDLIEDRDETRRKLRDCLRKLSQKTYDTQYFKKLFKKINYDKYSQGDRPPHLHPGTTGHSRSPEKGVRGTRHAERMREGRPFPHPSARHPPKPQPKTGGAMSIIMPIYTIGIVVFFLYTVLKLVFKKQSPDDKKPLVKDFHMDPEYHKYVLRDDYTDKKDKKKETVNIQNSESTDKIIDEKEDYEIYQLRKRLQEMEATMERIVSHMGQVSDCIASNISANIQAANLAKSNIVAASSTLENGKNENIKKEREITPININDITECRERIQNLKTSDLSPSIDSYEILGNSLSTTPLEEIGPVRFISSDARSFQNLETSRNSLHPETNDVASFDRESSVASEASSFELLCHSRDTRSASPEENGQKDEDFVKMGKADSVGSIDNISLDQFPADGPLSDHQEDNLDSQASNTSLSRNK
ncbi:resistance to inhibitors of cholinesterase protein 3-like isoform X2 [Centruroides vittatus]|uniref:resistance to inhibitors of cholinesterase protein 3-like isoform X2 n=1 Tax=Centruroides vittatus TaxID=120091 RepID=UPI00350EE2E4